MLSFFLSFLHGALAHCGERFLGAVEHAALGPNNQGGKAVLFQLCCESAESQTSAPVCTNEGPEEAQRLLLRRFRRAGGA